MNRIWDTLIKIIGWTVLNFIAYVLIKGPQGLSWPSPGPPSFGHYAADIFNKMIEWDVEVISQVSQGLMSFWFGINNPIIRCLVFWGSLLILLNLYWAWRDWVLLNKLSLKCTACELRAMPIAGTKNRYRCPNKHQFFGDPHDRF